MRVQSDARKQRLAEALRRNLKRRKAATKKAATETLSGKKVGHSTGQRTAAASLPRDN